MPNSNIVKRVLSSSGVRLDSDALRYFAQLNPAPSAKYMLAVNNFVINCKLNGNWHWDRLWIFKTEYQQNARVSLVNPSSTIITEVNSPTWESNIGYTFDGLTQYLNTNYNPNNNGSEYTLNSACFMLKIENNTASGAQLDGGCGPTNNSTSGMWIGARSFTDKCFCRINEKTTLISAINGSTNSTGNWHSIRTSSTAEKLFLNGTVVLTDSARNSVALPVYDVYVGCVNNAGTPTNFSDRKFSFAGIGSGVINASTFNTDLNTLITALNS